MLTSEFFLLASAHFLALASPGPDFLLLVRNCLRHGRRNGIGASLGIALANGLYIALALAGFSLLQQSPAWLTIMKWAASVYLAWLGWLFMQSSLKPQALAGVGPAGARRHAGFAAGMGAGFLSAILNPKNGIFYFGLFTLIVGAQTGFGLKLVYGVWMFVAVFAWDAALVCALSQRRAMAWLARSLPMVERGAGLLLMAAAAALALSRS
ncbi:MULTISPECIES: LysE family translocator [unclassified Herbaspirillum]|uniref:LysE family translocator n=1 Tax=unclassified Herbaspirillum TaxID=2624150 RepID=UPI001151BAED|nr:MULTISPECIES: LysE family translocator [unclassified Herbaspirillum]MBB5391646.1 threonine/homoserine/homoserine lactone efflux protein [Herbaspirillum sp. SJZ102]TQK12673.1 threonine/homoserine/homoserine lactone efflux protein [Herbaspirillum sp. SJZ130]TQK14677.1 threonine/homoserine/homoserine lactone efflux protein [Herbaspirillum sp. SJZ106]